MDYKQSILECNSVEELDDLFKKLLTSAGDDQAEQVKQSNCFCSALEELMSDGKVNFPSGGVDFLGFAGGRIPSFKPNTVVNIQK